MLFKTIYIQDLRIKKRRFTIRKFDQNLLPVNLSTFDICVLISTTYTLKVLNMHESEVLSTIT